MYRRMIHINACKQINHLLQFTPSDFQLPEKRKNYMLEGAGKEFLSIQTLCLDSTELELIYW